MIELPPYFLTQPVCSRDEATIASFERLFADITAAGTGETIDYTLSAPKWQFLCYLTDNKNIVLHGSGNPAIEEFEPRQSNDVNEFGNRQAIYAASDGIWPIYFAIVDRDRYSMSLVNSSFRVLDEAGQFHGPYYYFSIDYASLRHQPWRNGTIYLLPRDTFEQQSLEEYRGMRIDMAHWASAVSVRPLGKLSVGPEDFPFLSQIVGHEPAVIRERAAANPDGFPWLDE